MKTIRLANNLPNILLLTTLFVTSCMYEGKKTSLVRWPSGLKTSMTDSCQVNQTYFQFDGCKVVHFVNTDCSICLLDFRLLDSIMPLFADHNCQTFIVAFGNRKETIGYYLDQTHLDIPIFWDNENHFLNSGIFTLESDIRTLLVNEDNYIVLAGNFSRNPSDIRTFLNHLK